MVLQSNINCQGQLSAVLIKCDGSQKNLGVLARHNLSKTASRLNRLRSRLAKLIGPTAAILMLANMAQSGHIHPLTIPMLGLVTTAGVKYMASDFASGGVTPTVSGFKFHDSGIGTTAAANTDTAIQTPPSPQPARVSGVGTTPGSTNIYQTVATIAYTGTNAITEWGLFSASSSGTLWDRRVFSAINVVSADSIQFTYSLTIPSN